MAELRMWVVYDLGTDGNWQCYRAREWVASGKGPVPTNNLVTAATLEMVRGLFRTTGLTQMPRWPDDPPNVLEVWL